MARVLLAALFVLTTGCASIRLEGVSGPVTWRATDLALEIQSLGDEDRQIYSFMLVLKETSGVGITFTRISRALYFRETHYTGSTAEATGRWRLDGNGELRLPFSSSLRCVKNGGPMRCLEIGSPPLWQFVFTGEDDRGQAVRLVIDVALPQDPRS